MCIHQTGLAITDEVYRGPYGEYNDNVINAAEAVNSKTIQWNLDTLDNRTINSIELRNQIINGTRRMANQLYPNREEGYGRLDVYQAILNMRNL